jgi:hypothetical protein
VFSHISPFKMTAAATPSKMPVKQSASGKKSAQEASGKKPTTQNGALQKSQVNFHFTIILFLLY